MPGPEDAALAFDRACGRASIRYAIVGGLAVGAWGQPRATADVDALVALTRSGAEAFARCLVDEGLSVEPRDIEDAIRDRSHLTVFHPPSGFHVDVKLVDRPEEGAQIEAAVRLRIGAGSLFVARAEDTVAFKLLYGSPQDLQDARSILNRQGGRLDETRLQTLALRLGVKDALARVRAEEE